MEPFLYRLLTGCLVIWLVDKVLAVFKVGEPAKSILMIVTVILALLWILLGKLVLG